MYEFINYMVSCDGVVSLCLEHLPRMRLGAIVALSVSLHVARNRCY